jgi:hypothetical protein
MSFCRQGDLNRHSEKHRPGEFPCIFPNCGKVFYRKDKLRLHWEKEHGESSQPSDLSSSRPRKDHDRDGNFRSDDPSKRADSGLGGRISEKRSEGGSSDTSGSSSYDCHSSGYSCSSCSVESEAVVTDGDVDIKSDIDTNTDNLPDLPYLRSRSEQLLQEPAGRYFGESQRLSSHRIISEQVNKTNIISHKVTSKNMSAEFTYASYAQAPDSSAPLNSTESAQVVTQPNIASGKQVAPLKFENISAQGPQCSSAPSISNSSAQKIFNCSSTAIDDIAQVIYPVPDSPRSALSVSEPGFDPESSNLLHELKKREIPRQRGLHKSITSTIVI